MNVANQAIERDHRSPGSTPQTRLRPLYVDLDGTLIRTDLLWESFVAALREHPLQAIVALCAMFYGRAEVKRALASISRIDVTVLPYRMAFVDWLRQQRAAGRRLVLATAADQVLAQQVADHLVLFDQVIASDGRRNIKGRNKLRAILNDAAGRPFDYCGNGPDDVIIFRHATAAIVVDANRSVLDRALVAGNVDQQFCSASNGIAWRAWWEALRPLHWVKNLLVMVPFFTAFLVTDTSALLRALLAAVAMCFAASAGYLVNDLLDVHADRAHPRKRERPFAAGRLNVAHGIAVALVLLLAATSLAAQIGLVVLAWVSVYLLATFSYSTFFKREPIVDVMVLAGLYTLRVMVGSSAVHVELSFWLLAFSVFFFFGLALMKRCGELVGRQRGEQTNIGRAYRQSDLMMLQTIGIASGIAAVLVLALYVQTPVVAERYPVPQALWLALVALIVWTGRAWLDTVRGQMHDDPLIYAIRHRRGRIVLMLIVASFSVASLWGLGGPY